jgi:hypothetical protein
MRWDNVGLGSLADMAGTGLDVLCGWLPRCKGKFDAVAWSGAVFCPAC